MKTVKLINSKNNETNKMVEKDKRESEEKFQKNLSLLLKQYDMIHERWFHHDKRLWTTLEIYIVIIGILFSVYVNLPEDIHIFIVTVFCIFGLILSIFWYFTLHGTWIWRSWYSNRGKEIESILNKNLEDENKFYTFSLLKHALTSNNKKHKSFINSMKFDYDRLDYDYKSNKKGRRPFSTKCITKLQVNLPVLIGALWIIILVFEICK